MQVNIRRNQGTTIDEKFNFKIFNRNFTQNNDIKKFSENKKNIPKFWKNWKTENENLFFSIATISFMNLIDL